MNRRGFLRTGIACGAVATGAGAFLFWRRNNARAAVHSQLLNDALPRLTSSSRRQQEILPVQAREEIRRFFHGKCLNVESFVAHISSDSFRERLGRCSSDDDRQETLLAAFCARIASEGEILNQVDIIATEIGSALDSEWDGYCRELSSTWNVTVKGYGSPVSFEDLTRRVNGMIRADLSRVLQAASAAGQTPALGSTIENIGESAIKLLPVVRFGKVGLVIGVAVFVVLAAKEVWDYVLGQLDDRRADYQAAISARIALLGNRVGAQFEREVRQRVSDLHGWQERSVREAAIQMVQERIGLT